MPESALNTEIRPSAGIEVFQANWQGGLPLVTESCQSETSTGVEPAFQISMN